MSNLDFQRLRDLGLDPEAIVTHERRVIESLTQQRSFDWNEIEECKFENFGIVSSDAADRFISAAFHQQRQMQFKIWKDENILSITLAAGAATRFLSGIASLCSSKIRLKNSGSNGFKNETQSQLFFSRICFTWNNGGIKAKLLRLLRAKLASHPFHDFKKINFAEINLDDFLSVLSKCRQTEIFQAEKIAMNLFIREVKETPKLLIPLNKDGDAFIDFTIWQLKGLLPKIPMVFVVSPEVTQSAEKSAARTIKVGFEFQIINGALSNVFFTTQDHDLDTIRFLVNGEPFREEDGSYSPVPAGHGEVIKLFSTISQRNETVDCFLIQTIDNIYGKSLDVEIEYNKFLETFYALRWCVDRIRLEIALRVLKNDSEFDEIGLFSEETSTAIELLLTIMGRTVGDSLYEKRESSYKFIYNLLDRLFCFPQRQVPVSNLEKFVLLQKYLCRPIVVVGVVRREKNDAGGHPGFVKKATGERIRICLEGSRFKNPLNDESKIVPEEIYINSGIAIVETRIATLDEKTRQYESRHFDFHSLQNDEFFLVSKKRHKGRNVYYHETALYEILSNSENTNCLFLEISRVLFKPNKDILSILGKDRKDFGF